MFPEQPRSQLIRAAIRAVREREEREQNREVGITEASKLSGYSISALRERDNKGLSPQPRPRKLGEPRRYLVGDLPRVKKKSVSLSKVRKVRKKL